MGYDLEEGVDPLQFDQDDFANGAYYPTRDNHTGEISFRKKPKSPTRLKRGRVKLGYTNKIDDMTMAQFKADMAALWRDGETYPAIAEAVNEKYGLIPGEDGYTGNDIHWHIKRMLEYWRNLSASRIDERQAMLLARLDQIEQLCIEAYFASLEGKRTHIHTKQLDRARSKDRMKQLLEVEKQERRDKAKYELPWNKKNKPQVNVPDDFEGMMGLLTTTAERSIKVKRHERNPSGDVKWMTLIFNINRERAKILGLYNKENAHDPEKDAAKLTDEQRQQRLIAIVNTAKARRQDLVNTALAEPAPLGGFQEPDVTDDPPPEIEEDEGWDIDEVEVPDEEDDTVWN